MVLSVLIACSCKWNGQNGRKTRRVRGLPAIQQKRFETFVDAPQSMPVRNWAGLATRRFPESRNQGYA